MSPHNNIERSSLQYALFILRHGESSFEAITDHRRELTPLGIQQVLKAADHLYNWIENLCSTDIDVEVSVSVSDAHRTLQTFEVIKGVLSDRGVSFHHFEQSSTLYLASHQRLHHHLLEKMTAVRSDSSRICDRSLMRLFVLIGHNPGLSDLINLLSGDPISLKTGGHVCLRPLDESLVRWSQC